MRKCFKFRRLRLFRVLPSYVEGGVRTGTPEVKGAGENHEVKGIAKIRATVKIKTRRPTVGSSDVLSGLSSHHSGPGQTKHIYIGDRSEFEATERGQAATRKSPRRRKRILRLLFNRP